MNLSPSEWNHLMTKLESIESKFDESLRYFTDYMYRQELSRKTPVDILSDGFFVDDSGTVKCANCDAVALLVDTQWVCPERCEVKHVAS